MSPSLPTPPARRIRVFISSTFRDMMAERDELMTHAWPELRRLCRERQVELVEVDLRWGIAEEQSTRKETLKLCLDEIRACRPFFLGVLGARYGWVPGDDAFTADLREEQPWLKDLRGKSVTELEILHGVLNNPDLAERAFFYFRDSHYVASMPPDKKSDFCAESPASAEKQRRLKARVRATCAAKHIPLRENYPAPRQLATLVLADLKAVIEAQFPVTTIPGPLDREARDHEAFAETRRRTYIGRPDYFAALDRHAAGDGRPLAILGDSGSGKSALLANWLEHWGKAHPRDFRVQHYIGSTPDSAEHWQLMTRLIAEIKRWSGDPEELPRTHDDLLRTFPVWLAKARNKAERDGVRCLIVLDALNQLEDRDHARRLGWLPVHPFSGPLRLVVSTLPVEPPQDDPKAVVDDPLRVVTEHGWATLRVQPLTHDERRRMMADYLQRFGKKLDAPRLERLAAAPAAANPLYLKSLLDELRVTGTHEGLDERLREYLAATDIPALLKKVLARYEHDYERDRPGLVSEALGLLGAARRGLTETELLRLLKPAHLPQLPLAVWTPLRSALEEGLVDRGGILNFAHDFLRTAVATAFVPDHEKRDVLRRQLADDFEQQPISPRSCDELPWLLWQTKQRDRLRACLLNIDRFLQLQECDVDELMRYWVGLEDERMMGKAYLGSFERWSRMPGRLTKDIAPAANELGAFLHHASLHAEAEPMMRRALAMDEQCHGPNHPSFARNLNNLGQLLKATNRLAEAESLMHRALTVWERALGEHHPNVASALNNLAQLLRSTNRLKEAEPLMRRALSIDEQSHGPDHPEVARDLNNVAQLLQATNRLAEAEPLMRRALSIDERCYGAAHPEVASDLNNLALLLQATNRRAEAETMLRQALAINEQSYGPDHPQVSNSLNNLAWLLEETSRLAEAEPLLRRALLIDERAYGADHPKITGALNNLALLLRGTNRLAEAEALVRRALAIDERSYGADHPEVATDLNNLAILFQATQRLAEAEPPSRRALAILERSLGKDHENVANALNNLAALLKAMHRLPAAKPLSRRALQIFLKFTRATGHVHPRLQGAVNNYARLLKAMGRSPRQVQAQLNAVSKPYGIHLCIGGGDSFSVEELERVTPGGGPRHGPGASPDRGSPVPRASSGLDSRARRPR